MDEAKLTVLVVSGGVWRTASVDEQPELTLTSWSVRQVADGNRHFVGWCVENREGRTSSKVVQFDPTSLRGVTDSGRIYQLSGKPGFHSDADYVWNRWLHINGLEHNSWIDVTASVAGST